MWDREGSTKPLFRHIKAFIMIYERVWLFEPVFELRALKSVDFWIRRVDDRELSAK